MTKADTYIDVQKQIAAVLEGEANITARMVTIICLLHQNFDDYFWTGFYLVDPEKSEELVIGPYQGTLGCLRIPFTRGVCGAAAQDGKTIIVEDVHAFPGHIACDSRSESEIVVPVFDAKGNLFAVLDVDSTRLAAFDATDQHYLEQICGTIFA
ncbi:GAF domain-containing protein [Litorimonas sp. RW-G-Af-16]|uniref:GAF domain-containing protein n=1 Tax=Litorimonas sp. RW-G-Af-16 TaxID=3241168 RepID=UPI00390C64C2